MPLASGWSHHAGERQTRSLPPDTPLQVSLRDTCGRFPPHSPWQFACLKTDRGAAACDEFDERVGASLRRCPVLVLLRPPGIGILEEKLGFDSHECAHKGCCYVGPEVGIDVVPAVSALGRLELQEGSPKLGHGFTGNEDRTLAIFCVRFHVMRRYGGGRTVSGG